MKAVSEEWTFLVPQNEALPEVWAYLYLRNESTNWIMGILSSQKWRLLLKYWHTYFSEIYSLTEVLAYLVLRNECTYKSMGILSRDKCKHLSLSTLACRNVNTLHLQQLW